MDNNKIKEALILKHYNNLTKNIFNFLADFFTNKFYTVIYNLATQYTQKNNFTLEENYINILDNYLDSLIIKNPEEEEKKSKIISNFIKILYENYMKYINNQMIDMDDFLLKIVQSYLPNNHREEIYVKDKNNIAIIFHTIITSISEYMIEFIKLNLNLVLQNRVKENLVIIKKDFIYIFCKVKENLEINFNNEEENINNEFSDNEREEINCEEMIKNNVFYIALENKYNDTTNENKKLKFLVKELMEKNKKITNDIIKMKKLLVILNNKLKQQPQTQSQTIDIDTIPEVKKTNINDILNNKIDKINKDIEIDKQEINIMNDIEEENPFSDLLIN
jgi:hypothetical protein